MEWDFRVLEVEKGGGGRNPNLSMVGANEGRIWG